MSFAKHLSVSIAISYSISLGAWYLYAYYIKYKANKIPTKWKRVGKVEKIILYPLKSGGLRIVDQAECTELGLREISKDSTGNKYLFRDRSFVIYGAEDNKAIGIFKHKKVVLISLESVDLDQIVLKAPGVEEFTLELSKNATRHRVHINLYGVTLEAVDCGDEVSKWLSKFLTHENEIFRLGFYIENIVQRPDPIGTTLKVEGFSSIYKHWRKNDGGAYSHLTSYMIVTSPSIKDVNSKLPPEDQFSYRHLRPNIVVDGCEKYSEDTWKWIKIGDEVVLRWIKPCTRCANITVDPNTAQDNKHLEPLKILKSYRTVKHLFGQNLQGDLAVLGINAGLYESGEIHIDDEVYISV